MSHDSFDDLKKDEDETASTQAVDMSEVHAQIQRQLAAGGGPVPGLPKPGGPQPGAGSGRPGPKVTVSEEGGPRLSGILAAVGGGLIFLSFFFGWYSGAYLYDEAFEEVGKDRYARSIVRGKAELDEVPEDLREKVEIAVDFMQALGMDDVYEEMEEASSRDERKDVLRNYTLSPLQLMRAAMVADFNADVLLPNENKRKEGTAVFRGMWWSTVVLMLIALGAAVISGLRRFQALNTLQVAGNGLFGLLFVITGAALCFVPETHKAGGVDIPIFMGIGRYMLLLGGLSLWISAFAGLTKSNWWKAPLLAIALFLGYAVIVGGPVGLALL